MGRLRSLLASVRDDDSGVDFSPISATLRQSRTQFVTPLPPPLMLRQSSEGPTMKSPRSEGAIHALADLFATDVGTSKSCSRVLVLWSLWARDQRHRLISFTWWAHATATAAMALWRRRTRYWRVQGAAIREALWVAISRAFMRWRLRTCDGGTAKLGWVAGQSAAVARCLLIWAGLFSTLTRRRVDAAGEFLAASLVLAMRHERARALRHAVAMWQLTAARRRWSSLQGSRSRHPAARRALQSWQVHSVRRGLRMRQATEWACAATALVLKRAMRTWHVRGLFAPLERLKAERAVIGRLVLALDRWRRRARDWSGGSGMRPRRSRGAAERAASARSAHPHALLVALKHAWHVWQMRRLESSLAVHTRSGYAMERLGAAVDVWRARSGRSALVVRMTNLAWSSALVIALRLGWNLLAAAGRAHRTARALTMAAAHARTSQRATALRRWRAAGRYSWPLYSQLVRVYELLRALLLLFRWRQWADDCLAARHDALLSGALPLIHGVRRWRARSARCAATSARDAHVQRAPLVHLLRPALNRWLASAAQSRRASVLVTIANSDATTTRLARGLRTMRYAYWRRAHLRQAWAHRRRRAIAAALLRWRWHRAESEAARAASGVRQCIRDGLEQVGRARAFGHWVRSRHLAAAKHARALRGGVMARHAAWRRTWDALVVAAALERARALCSRRLMEARRTRALVRWCTLCRWRSTSLMGRLAWRVTAARAACAVWRGAARRHASAMSGRRLWRHHALSAGVVAWRVHAVGHPDYTPRVRALQNVRRDTTRRRALSRMSATCQHLCYAQDMAARASGMGRRAMLLYAIRTMRTAAHRRTTQLFLTSLGGDGGGEGRRRTGTGTATGRNSTSAPPTVSAPPTCRRSLDAALYTPIDRHRRDEQTKYQPPPPPSRYAQSPQTCASAGWSPSRGSIPHMLSSGGGQATAHVLRGLSPPLANVPPPGPRTVRHAWDEGDSPPKAMPPPPPRAPVPMAPSSRPPVPAYPQSDAGPGRMRTPGTPAPRRPSDVLEWARKERERRGASLTGVSPSPAWLKQVYARAV